MTTNEHLTELERELEADLLAARRELELGRAEAIETLSSISAALGGGGDAVQGRLGELNYILAEEGTGDLEMFDRYRDRILDGLNEAVADLARLKTRGREWSRHEKTLNAAWRQLSKRLDSVRGRLAGEADTAEKEFDSQRSNLRERLDQAAEAQPLPRLDIVTRLRNEFRQVLPGIKAMFVHPDETVPKTPEEKRAQRQ